MLEAAKLTPFQKRFSALVVQGTKPTQAVRDLKFKGRRPDVKASKLMALPHVQAEIERLAEQAMRDEGVTQAGIIRDIVRVKDRCMQAEPVRDDEGNETGEWTFREHGALKALELLGRYKRMWNDDRPVAPVVGPGLTVIVQQGTQVNGQQTVQTHRVEVNLPRPA